MVRTRFAPSPTGYLHIGGVRTALFNWLFAKKLNGQFILRVDDTDQHRNVDEALKPILDGFRWLGMKWDEGPDIGGPYAPYFQSQRVERYRAAVETLLNQGNAYYDYATPEETQAERTAAEVEKRHFVASRRWMATTDADRAKFEAQGRQSVVRLNMPREGSLVVNDLVRGQVSFQWDREQDHVIQRADGSCLYHLATVVDDFDYRISHVIRAEEHLSNTPRQIFIAQSLGYTVPEFAHIPYVAEPGSRTKLSKRKLAKYQKHRDFAALCRLGQQISAAAKMEVNDETFNPVLVDFYRELGYLPDALMNYLLLLGWSLDDHTEFFSPEAMVEHFSLERVNRAPASFDPQKLTAFQAHYMRMLPIKQKVALVLPFLQKAGWVSVPPPCEVGDRIRRIVEAAGDRIVVAGDILNFGEFFTNDQHLTYEPKSFEKRLNKSPESAALLAEFRDRLAAHTDFSAASLETLLKQFVTDQSIKIGQIVHALRVAVTGKAVGFGVFETLEILGKESCLARIRRALDQVQK